MVCLPAPPVYSLLPNRAAAFPARSDDETCVVSHSSCDHGCDECDHTVFGGGCDWSCDDDCDDQHNLCTKFSCDSNCDSGCSACPWGQYNIRSDLQTQCNSDGKITSNTCRVCTVCEYPWSYEVSPCTATANRVCAPPPPPPPPPSPCTLTSTENCQQGARAHRRREHTSRSFVRPRSGRAW